MIGGSIVVFQVFHYHTPYYNDYFAKFYDVMTGVNIWTVFCLMLAKLVEQSGILVGTIIVYLIGVPF